jgi:amino acid transporter
MFAVYPTAGGQYHWAYMVSSPRYRAAVSWFTGMLNVIGLWLGIATAAYLCANMVVSIILVNNPGFVNTPSTQYGIFVAMTLFAPLSMICVGNRANRMLEYVLMALSCVGGLVIAVTLLATQSPKASAVSLPKHLCGDIVSSLRVVVRIRWCRQYNRLGLDRHCMAYWSTPITLCLHRL